MRASVPVPPPAARRAVVWLGALVFALALLLRLPGLDSRPFHPDEAVNAHLLDGLLNGEGYRYRQHDHHGPTLYRLSASVLTMTGPTRAADWEAWMLRLFPAVAGSVVAAVAAIWLAVRVDLRSGLAAGVLLGLAAPYVYYSGSFIHEMLLIALLLGWFACAWACATTDSLRPAWLGGLFAGLMLATKETAAPILGLLLLAIIAAARPPLRRVFAALLRATPAALLVVLLFYSDFGREPARALDLFRAVGEQVARGTGEEHAYPFSTYFRWFLSPIGPGLPWSGWLLVDLGLFGFLAGRREPLPRALALGFALLALFFSALPYKTPWLVLAPALPLALLAALGAARLSRLAPGRVAVMAPVLLLASLLASETFERCVRWPVAPDNPLAYSPGSPDLARLALDLDRLAGDANPVVQVVAEDYWPLPWTLRRYRAGFWSEPPATLQAGLLLVSPAHVSAVAGRARDFAPYELRPGLTLFLARVP